MKIADVIAPLERLAPTPLQEDYDNSGLLVGQMDQDIEAALVCLDCTEAVIQEAIAKGAGLVVAHHPIILRGLKRFNQRNYAERTVELAIKHDVAIYACHTNLDKVHGGVNTKLADLLGLSESRILRPERGNLCKLSVFVPMSSAEEVRDALFQAGAGAIGNYAECSFSVQGQGTFLGAEGSDPFVGKVGKRHTEAEEHIAVVCQRWQLSKVVSAMKASHPYEEVAYDVFPMLNKDPYRGLGMIGKISAMEQNEFLSHLHSTLGLHTFNYSGNCNARIETVAVCGGSGFELLADAKANGAQVFITADIKYHQFFDAEEDLILVDIGHYESEWFTIELIAEILKADLPKFAVHLTRVNTNPVQHFPYGQDSSQDH